ncbi:glycosyltransferase family 61 protein [Paracoccus nototheniae]|uniref:glycosyltransferase family 61 protein n=1 Tax=Paracoccus nototheniae TaxID=2489002 RepID=UPI0013F4B454|nr:glycosyltransferase family 61 protein [Paracoccus nototheniae]
MPDTACPAQAEPGTVNVRSARQAGARLLWRDPQDRQVPRAGLALVDLRRPGIAEYANPQHSRAIAEVAQLYTQPVPARDDQMHTGDGFVMYRGQIWTGNTAIEHAFHPNIRDTLPAEHARILRLTERKVMETPAGGLLYFQKPGTANYFHWMVECLPRLSLMDDAQLDAQVDRLILHFGQLPGFVMPSLQAFFPRLVDRTFVTGKPLVRPDRLCFMTSGLRDPTREPETRISTSAIRFLGNLARGDRPGGQVIFVSRANAGNRRLINEDQLIAYLAARFDLQVMIGDRLSVAEQRQVMAQARAVVGVHGAGLSNVVFAPQGARLIEITSGQYVSRTASFHDTSLICGVTPRLALVEEHGDRTTVVANVGNDLYLHPSRFGRIAAMIAD